jgi:hypothetical protein
MEQDHTIIMKPITIRSLSITDFNIPSLAFLVFFVHQYILPEYFFPFLLKLQISKITVPICYLYAVFGWKSEKTKYSSPVLWAFIILGIIFFLARFFVDAPELTKYYFKEHLDSISVGMVLLYYFRDTRKIHLLIVALIVVSCFTGFISIQEGGMIWKHPFLQDENQISAYMTMMIPVTIFYSFFTQNIFYKVMCYIAVMIQLSEVVVSVSRGGFVALVAITGCMLIFSKHKILFITIILIGFIGVIQFAPPLFFSEVSTLEQGTDEGTAGARVEYWRRATVMFMENPFLGKGIAQFSVLSHKYVLPGKKIHPTNDFLVAHSNWFQVLSELGAVGVILYFIIFYQYFKVVFLVARKYKLIGMLRLGQPEYDFYHNITIGLAIGMVGFMVAGTFINILLFPFFYTFVFLMMLIKTTFLEKIHIPKIAVIKNSAGKE